MPLPNPITKPLLYRLSYVGPETRDAASNSAQARRSSRFPMPLARPPPGLTTASRGPDCRAMSFLRSVAVAAALLAACSKPSAPQGPADVQVSTDLHPGMVETALAM